MRPIVTALTGFAHRIGRRHLRRDGGARRIDLPLVQTRRTFASHVWHRHVPAAAAIQARLFVTLLGGERIAEQSDGRRQPSPLRNGPAPPIAEALAHLHTKHEVSALRLVERLKRVEVTTSATPRPTVTGESVGADRGAIAPHGLPAAIPPFALFMPLVRDAAAAASRPAIAGRSAGHEEVTRVEGGTDRPVPSVRPPHHADVAAMLPDGDIHRLAARVIGSIDQRIAAARERLGRF